MKHWKVLLSIVVLGAILGVAACATPGNLTTAPTGLMSITVSPANPRPLPVGSTQEFRATGKYADGSTEDVTSQATWISMDPSVASVGGGSAVKQIAFANAAGTTVTFAQMDGITSSGVTLTVPSSSLTDSLLIYLDSNYKTLWDSDNQPDLNNLHWAPDTNESSSPYVWQQATLTVYLWNKNASTVAVDAEDNLNSVSPGFSVHSDSVTIKPGERSSLNITVEESNVPGSAGDLSFNVWFNVRKAN